MTKPYQPRQEVASAVKDKKLVMLVGPTAIGKSSLMNQVVTTDERFKRVSGATTRPARANDEPGMYRYVTKEQSNQLITSSDLIQYAVFPTTGMIYGSQPQDYPGEYNMLDTLSGAVAALRALPFAESVTISLTTQADTWLKWLHLRYPHPSTERTNRLEEARQSILWSLAQTNEHYWLVNRPDALDATARELIRLCETRPSYSAHPTQASKLLEAVESLLSYE